MVADFGDYQLAIDAGRFLRYPGSFAPRNAFCEGMTGISCLAAQPALDDFLRAGDNFDLRLGVRAVRNQLGVVRKQQEFCVTPVPDMRFNAAVVFLAAESSLYITGQTLLVDGGISTGATRALPKAR